MQNLAIMDVLHRKANLCEPVKNLTFFKSSLFIPAGSDGLGKVPALSVLHHDLQFVLLGGVDLHEAHDEWMLKCAQDLCFLDGFLLLLLTHVIDADFLDHQQLARLLATHQVGLSEGTLPQQFFLLVHLVLGLNYPHLHKIYSNNKPIIHAHPFIHPPTYKVILLMRVTRKFLRFQDMQLVATEEHPKDVSRALLRIIDTANNNEMFKTFRYGAVDPMKITWDSEIELPYRSQESFRFETVCEHEFGYELEELKAIYNGIIYIRPDQFFFDSTAHCFNDQGKQCGVLKYMVKVVEREETKKKEEKVEVKQPVRVNLVAKISIYSASLSVNSYFSQVFHKRKHNKLGLEVKYGNSHFIGHHKKENTEYKWSFTSKFQVSENDPDEMTINVSEDDRPYLKGTLPMATLQQNKRFTVQIVPLFDQADQNIASLHIDLRYITKKELLDLMYSPTQLSDNKRQREQVSYFQSRKRTSSALAGLPNQNKLAMLQSQSRAISKELSNSKISPSNRYKIALLSEKHETSIPRSKRFSDPKGINEKVSYLDPDLLSDFSSKKKARGATQSSTNKTDFTKMLKGNPGVGEYHLPSIWEKR